MSFKTWYSISILLAFSILASAKHTTEPSEDLDFESVTPPNDNDTEWDTDSAGRKRILSHRHLFPLCSPLPAPNCFYKTQDQKYQIYCCRTLNLLGLLTTTNCDRNIHYPHRVPCDCGNDLCPPPQPTPLPPLPSPHPPITFPPVTIIPTHQPITFPPITTKPTHKPVTKKPAPPKPVTKKPVPVTTKAPVTPKPTLKPKAKPTKKVTPKPTQKVTPKPTQKVTPKPTQKVTSNPTEKVTHKPPPPQTTHAPHNTTIKPGKAIKCYTCESTRGDSSLACKDNPKSTLVAICKPGQICRTLTYISEARGGSVIIRGCVDPGDSARQRKLPKGCVENPPFLPPPCDEDCGHTSCACTCNTNLCNNQVFPGQGWNACN